MVRGNSRCDQKDRFLRLKENPIIERISSNEITFISRVLKTVRFYKCAFKELVFHLEKNERKAGSV